MFTLQGRLALVNVAVLLIALILLGVIVLNQVGQDLNEQLDLNLQTLSQEELTEVQMVEGIPLFATDINEMNPKLGPAGFVRLLDAQGRITTGLGAYESVPVSPQSLRVPPQGLRLQSNHASRLAAASLYPTSAG